MIVSAVACVTVIVFMLGITSSATAPPVALSVAYGFWSGTLIALVGAMIGTMAPSVHEIGMRTGVTFLVGGIASLAGTPVTGAVLGADFDWWKAIVLAAVTMGVGVIGLVFTRFNVAHRKGSAFV